MTIGDDDFLLPLEEFLSLVEILRGKIVNFKKDEGIFQGSISAISQTDDGALRMTLQSVEVRSNHSSPWSPLRDLPMSISLKKEDKIWSINDNTKLWIQFENGDTMTIHVDR